MSPKPFAVRTGIELFPGVLIECDPSIKSIIVNIDSDNHDYIIEDLDDTHLVIKETQLASLKAKLEQVSYRPATQLGRACSPAHTATGRDAAGRGRVGIRLRAITRLGRSRARHQDSDWQGEGAELEDTKVAASEKKGGENT